MPTIGWAGTYSINKVADDGATSPYSFFFGYVGINGAGKPVFRADPRVGADGFFDGANPAADVLVDEGGSYAELGTAVAIDESNGIIFRARQVGEPGNKYTAIYNRTDPAAGTLVPSGAFKSIDENPVMSGGHYLFPATTISGTQGLFTGPDPQANVVATSGGAYSFFRQYAISANGSAAFSAKLSDGSSGIFTGQDPATSAIVKTGTAFSAIFGFDLSSAGRIVFGAAKTSGSEGIFTGPDPVADAAITEADGYYNFDAYAINDSGLIVFKASKTNGTPDTSDDVTGLFVRDGSQITQIVLEGDMIAGSVVQSISFAEDDLNNAGQIAFLYDTIDPANSNRTLHNIGITTVPEPSAATVCLAVGMLGMTRRAVRGERLRGNVLTDRFRPL